MRKFELNSNLAGAFFLLGGGIAGHAMLETARDALFLRNLPSDLLPWAYILVAVFAGIIVVTTARLQQRLNIRKLIAVSYFGAALVTLGFFVLFNVPAPPQIVAFVLYVWVGVYITFLVSSAWLLIAAVFTIDQAKRVFGIIAAGASIGAILGSAAAVAITSQMYRTDMVLLAAAATFAATGFVPYLFRLAPVVVETRTSESTRFLSELRANGYLKSIAGVALFSTIAVTALDWLFKATVADAVPRQELGGFFAHFHLIANTVALLTQLFVLQALFRLLGATRTLYIFSGIVLVGSVFILAAAGFYAVVALKLAEVGLKNSLHKPAIELLYVPLHDHVRKKFKIALDLISLRGGQAIASLALLLGALWVEPQTIAVAIMIVGAGTSLFILSRLKPKYVKLFHDYLREGRIGTSFERPKLDLLSIEAILDTLNDGNDSEIVAALELLRSEGKTSIIPGLILFHPSERVVLAALEIFSTQPRPELKKLGLRMLKDPRDRVRVATLRMLLHFDPPHQFLSALAEGRDQVLKPTAIVEMVRLGYVPTSKCRELVDQFKDTGNLQGLIDLCEAIAFREDSSLNRHLGLIYEVDDIEVKRAALAALAQRPCADCLDLAEQAYGRHALRIEAEKLFVVCGLPGFERLLSMLHSTEYSHDVRVAIPMSLGKFDLEDVQPRLLAALIKTRDGAIAYKLLRVLGRRRRQTPDAPLNERLLEQLTEDELRRFGEYLAVAVDLSRPRSAIDDTIFRMLFELIIDRAEEGLERLFRIFDLRHTASDFEHMYYALVSRDRKERAHAQELLTYTVNASQARKIIESIDELSTLRRTSRETVAVPRVAAPRLDRFVRDHLPTFRQLLRDESATVRALTAYFVGACGVIELRDDVLRAAQSDSPAIDEAFAVAIDMLGKTGEAALER